MTKMRAVLVLALLAVEAGCGEESSQPQASPQPTSAVVPERETPSLTVDQSTITGSQPPAVAEIIEIPATSVSIYGARIEDGLPPGLYAIHEPAAEFENDASSILRLYRIVVEEAGGSTPTLESDNPVWLIGKVAGTKRSWDSLQMEGGTISGGVIDVGGQFIPYQGSWRRSPMPHDIYIRVLLPSLSAGHYRAIIRISNRTIPAGTDLLETGTTEGEPPLAFPILSCEFDVVDR